MEAAQSKNILTVPRLKSILCGMKELTVSGDDHADAAHADAAHCGAPKLVSLAQWPEAVTRSAHQFEVNPLFFGHAVRTDRWSCRDDARPWHTLYLILEGEVPTAVGSSQFVLKPGTLFWLMPDERHDMQWPARLAFTEIWFRLQDGGRDLRLPEPVIVCDGAWDIVPLMEGIEDEMRRRHEGFEQKIRHWLAMVALEALRLGGSKPELRQLSVLQRARVTAFIRESLAARPSLEAMAHAARLSPDYFSRLFRNTYGLAPRDWMVRERIHAAARLLRETDLTIYQISQHLGYANVSQFSRQFAQVMALTARSYRQSED
jgi:AraC-like DNA-binding protein